MCGEKRREVIFRNLEGRRCFGYVSRFWLRMLKQFVVAEPEIQDQEVDQDYELVVLASDGLWDVVRNEDAVQIAQTEKGAARKLTETAFGRGSADNITCIVVKFHHDKADPEEPPPSPPQQNFEVKPESEETEENDKANSPPEECQQTSKEEPHTTHQS
ncbi:PREDICTED: probable protein phosphatase 2C 76 [Erythranthe guttata]|nr:PREDICTED: probable protein phosphatase 2C 76 [Erythranthe guttata]|eukprot:XP_012858062.1 PREDICTED: probable protein phosphatase 2C 76 [Erythranthe guttata]